MPNNVILRRIEVTGEYRPLSERSLVATVEISTPPTNSGPVYFFGDDGKDVLFLPSQWLVMKSIDLSHLLVKGAPGDVVYVLGGTWRN